MVHLANDAVLLAPVKLGSVLQVRTWAQNLRPHARGTQIDIVVEVWVESPSGGSPTLAWQGISTYLAKGVQVSTDATLPGQPVAQEASDHPVGRLSSRAAASVETSNAKEEWSAPYPTAQWALTPATSRAYAVISGDRNPIHTSALAAKAFGFPRAIAHGMYTAARALAEVGPARRGDTYRWTVEFYKPVLLPSKVDVAITPATDSQTLNYQGWNSKKQLRHFAGTVSPI